ncbi:GTP-binding protein Rho1 [Serendipita sp. 399]|nr:GTP-binding protein Rho1 [Serendipita sp. 399]
MLSNTPANISVFSRLVTFDFMEAPDSHYSSAKTARLLSYRNASVAIICFGIDNPRSLDRVEELWAPEIKTYFITKEGWCPPVILVGCKKDVRTDPEELERMYRCGSPEPVSVEMGRKVARRVGAAVYLECSAKTGEGVDEVFHHAARLLLLDPSRKISKR